MSEMEDTLEGINSKLFQVILYYLRKRLFKERVMKYRENKEFLKLRVSVKN